MSTKSIAWNDGSGDNITLSYTGQGNGSIVASSPENKGASRSKTITIKTTQGGIVTQNVTIVQDACPYVDLNLPSGLLWARGNIVADGNSYKIGKETDYGAYVSWGNIIPHFSTNGSTFDDGYDWGTSALDSPYNNTPGSNVSTDIQINDSVHDAALALLGSPWHLPTKTDLSELYENTDKEWTSINGIRGWKFMKKTNHSIYVFFPANGRGSGPSLGMRTDGGYYWTSSYRGIGDSYSLRFYSSEIILDTNARYLGFCIRAVTNSSIIY